MCVKVLVITVLHWSNVKSVPTHARMSVVKAEVEAGSTYLGVPGVGGSAGPANALSRSLVGAADWKTGVADSLQSMKHLIRVIHAAQTANF